MSLEETIGNREWVKENEDKIKNILPETWTHIQNLNGLQLGFQLKLIGIDWRSEEEFGKVFVFLEKMGILLREGQTFRRNPHSIFKS